LVFFTPKAKDSSSPLLPYLLEYFKADNSSLQLSTFYCGTFRPYRDLPPVISTFFLPSLQFHRFYDLSKCRTILHGRRSFLKRGSPFLSPQFLPVYLSPSNDHACEKPESLRMDPQKSEEPQFHLVVLRPSLESFLLNRFSYAFHSGFYDRTRLCCLPVFIPPPHRTEFPGQCSEPLQIS